MADEIPHRSRTAWPGPLSIAGVGEGHTHDLPPALLKRIRRQGRAVLIIGACVVALGVLFLLIILQRGEQRDRENDRLEEQIRQGQCDLLDQLPEGGLLDRPRAKYHCGPGIPVEQLTPDERELVDRRSAPAPVPVPQVPSPVSPQPESDAPPPDVMGGASPGAPRVVPEPPPSSKPDQPTPEPSPADVLSPVTEPLCDALGVCLEVP